MSSHLWRTTLTSRDPLRILVPPSAPPSVCHPVAVLATLVFGIQYSCRGHGGFAREKFPLSTDMRESLSETS